MNLLQQVRNRPPSELTRHLGSDLEIHAGNKQVPFPVHKARDIPKAVFRSRGLHVAKKIVGDHDVLMPESLDQFWRGGIPNLPRYFLAKPGFDAGLVAVQIEHVLHFMRGQTLKNRGADQPAGAGSVNAPFGEVQYFL